MSTNVVAIGVFDGVHLGHKTMLNVAKRLAGADGRVIVLTFDPHPRAVIADSAPRLLANAADRTRLLQEAGADHVVALRFDAALAALTAEQFYERYVRDELHANAIVVGDNFRFGNRAAGTPEILTKLANRDGITVEIVDLAGADGAPISSTRIRGLLATGDVADAGKLLGRPYTVAATVVPGARRGRELGMPTANLADIPERQIPADGVYGGIAYLDPATPYIAAISVGTNPQFTADDPNAPRMVEVHLLDYVGPEFYGAIITVSFIHRVRGQRIFPTLEALMQQMRDDVHDIRSFAAGQ